MKTVIPWILVVALLGGGYFLFSTGKQKDAQIAQLNQQGQELERLRAENTELQKIPVQKEELDRLRKEHEELLKLRNDVSRLRGETKQLSSQLAAAQAQSAKVQELQQQAANENQALRTQAEQAATQAKTIQAQVAACVNNLRQIDAAKQQWALENKKTADAVPTPEDLTSYLQNPGQIVCPAGGLYTINAVGVQPTCSVAGHVLSK